jgi:hypothetical protein
MQKFAYSRRAKAAQGGFKMSFLPKPGVRTVVVKRAIVLSAKPDDVADCDPPLASTEPLPHRLSQQKQATAALGRRCGGLGPFPVSIPRPGGAAHQSHCGRSEHGRLQSLKSVELIETLCAVDRASLAGPLFSSDTSFLIFGSRQYSRVTRSAPPLSKAAASACSLASSRPRARAPLTISSPPGITCGCQTSEGSPPASRRGDGRSLKRSVGC